MKIATIVFTYHRSIHTRRVLKALSENDILPEKLFVFQDGINDTTNSVEWKTVNTFIKEIDWCDAEIHVSETNMGLAKSIIKGIQFVLGKYDAVIVLEDDCVPGKQFMRFMIAALNNYEKMEKVYSISGYAWEVDLTSKDGTDAYFNGKSCSWGWGTWREKWCEYEEDYRILTRIKKDLNAKRRLNIWGKNLESMLIGNIKGNCDSWAVFWALKIIEKGGYCLSPYKSLIHNIGFDGSGTHGVKLQHEQIIVEDENKESFCFPEKVECTKECEEEFQFLFGAKYGEEKLKLYQDILIKWIQMKQLGKTISIPNEWGDGIAVWGRGRVFDCFLNELGDQRMVKYIIESRPSANMYMEIPIISINKLPSNIRNIIVIPYFDLDIIKAKVGKLRNDIRFWGIEELLN